MKKVIISALAFGLAMCSGYAQSKSKKAKKSTSKITTKTITKPMETVTLNTPITTASGLVVVFHEKGTGAKCMAGDNAVVHYTGKLTDGKKFDSSKDRNQPFTFAVGQGQVIKGWDEVLQLMHVGDKLTVTIPSELGYGASGAGASIPPNATLVFDIDLLDLKQAPKLFDVKEAKTITTESGLKVHMLTEGTGPNPHVGSNVKVHYSGFLVDGKMFDSSISRGEPIAFPLGQGRVIKGWDEGIALLKKGGKAVLEIPYSLAYGEQGYPPIIPQKATLLFNVELVDFQ